MWCMKKLCQQSWKWARIGQLREWILRLLGCGCWKVIWVDGSINGFRGFLGVLG